MLFKLEQKLGHFAIPGILRWLGGFQLLVWGMSLLIPSYAEMLIYDRPAILSGEVWRLVSFAFVPRTANPIWILIMVMFLWFINDSLEGAWGEFRLNVFVFATIFCLSITGMIPILPAGAGVFLHTLLFSACFLAFASEFPNQVINLFAVIPIKAKWLGFVDAAFLLVIVMGAPVMAILVLGGLTPYFVTFGPRFFREIRQRGSATARRTRFESQTRAGPGDAFHVCVSCGKTDVSHPNLDFRVTANGDELCEDCRKKPEPSA